MHSLSFFPFLHKQYFHSFIHSLNARDCWLLLCRMPISFIAFESNVEQMAHTHTRICCCNQFSGTQIDRKTNRNWVYVCAVVSFEMKSLWIVWNICVDAWPLIVSYLFMAISLLLSLRDFFYCFLIEWFTVLSRSFFLVAILPFNCKLVLIWSLSKRSEKMNGNNHNN